MDDLRELRYAWRMTFELSNYENVDEFFYSAAVSELRFVFLEGVNGRSRETVMKLSQFLGKGPCVAESLGIVGPPVLGKTLAESLSRNDSLSSLYLKLACRRPFLEADAHDWISFLDAAQKVRLSRLTRLYLDLPATSLGELGTHLWRAILGFIASQEVVFLAVRTDSEGRSAFGFASKPGNACAWRVAFSQNVRAMRSIECLEASEWFLGPGCDSLPELTTINFGSKVAIPVSSVVGCLHLLPSMQHVSISDRVDCHLDLIRLFHCMESRRVGWSLGYKQEFCPLEASISVFALCVLIATSTSLVRLTVDAFVPISQRHRLCAALESNCSLEELSISDQGGWRLDSLFNSLCGKNDLSSVIVNQTLGLVASEIDALERLLLSSHNLLRVDLRIPPRAVSRLSLCVTNPLCRCRIVQLLSSNEDQTPDIVFWSKEVFVGWARRNTSAKNDSRLWEVILNYADLGWKSPGVNLNAPLLLRELTTARSTFMRSHAGQNRHVVGDVAVPPGCRAMLKLLPRKSRRGIRRFCLTLKWRDIDIVIPGGRMHLKLRP